jgi:hypothetical protein
MSTKKNYTICLLQNTVYDEILQFFVWAKSDIDLAIGQSAA